MQRCAGWMLGESLQDLRSPRESSGTGGATSGLYSIRVNEQWRIVFRWESGSAFDVRTVDYHA